MHYESYLRTCEIILKNYNGKIPFASWLKDFFRQDKKYGSRDRRVISHFCYAYFRLGKAFETQDITSRIINGIFLSSQQPSPFLERFAPHLNTAIQEPLTGKMELLEGSDEWKNIFPFTKELSSEIDAATFALSHLQQPDMFLRIRPQKGSGVKKKLETAGVPFETCGETCIALPNGAPVDSILELDVEAVVQDRNSQQTVAVLKDVVKPSMSAWDCCAASGGKSIALYDMEPGIELTVSDIRESILINLENRFKKAGIRKYKSFVTDLASAYAAINENFDLVICDAPCSGSGTWGRTPEQLRFFPAEKIIFYSDLQKRIALNAAGKLNRDGYFLYITCSVFASENEEIVKFLLDETGMKLSSSQYWKGYGQKADTLFTALFRL